MRAREWIRSAGLSAATLILLVGGGEGFCRFRQRHDARRPMGRYITSWAAWDDDFYTVKSAAVGWPPWEDYNSDGVRDREHAAQKPAGVRRLVCLGDSTTLGWNIRPEEAYPQVLQDRLSAWGRNVEVFNVALGGWSPHQELVAYRRIARKYQPDQVLIGICLNDVPEMQNNLSPPPALLAGLYGRSALIRSVMRPHEREIQQIEDVFTRKDSSQVRSGFEKLFAELKTLRDEVQRDGARMVVLMFPARFQLAAKAPPPTPQGTVAGFCASEGIPYLDLLPVITQTGEGAFIDDVHLSPLGARVVAEDVLRSLLVEDDPHAMPAGGGQTVARQPAESLRQRVPALEAALRDGDVDQKVAAARALGTLGPEAVAAAPSLVAALGDRSPDLRAAAAWALGGIGGGRSALAVLMKRSADENPRVREAAAWALGRIGSRAQPVAAVLIPLLNDADDSVRWRAADALERIAPDPQDALAPLMKAIADREAAGRGAAAAIVGRMGPAAQPALFALIDALEDPRETVRWRAAWALGEIGPGASSAVPALVKAMNDVRIRGHAVDALGRVGPAARAALPVLTAALEDESANVRWRAAQTLANLGPAGAAAAPALLQRLGDSQENVRLAAVHAASSVGVDARLAVPAFSKCLSDPASRVRRAAAKALGRFGPEAREGADTLLEALQDDDVGVREEVARALRHIGFLPRGAIRVLTKAAADHDESVRREAIRTLKSLHAASEDSVASR